MKKTHGLSVYNWSSIFLNQFILIMLNHIANLDGVSILNKKQQESIHGGSGCKVFWRDSNGNAIGWSEETSYSIAYHAYHSEFTAENGNYVSGYCCASC